MLRVTRPGGKIIIVDVSPETSKRENYDCFECLCDLFHSSALTADDLTSLGGDHDFGRPEVIQFGLEMDVRQLIKSSFPESGSREELIDLLADDVEKTLFPFRFSRKMAA